MNYIKKALAKTIEEWGNENIPVVEDDFEPHWITKYLDSRSPDYNSILLYTIILGCIIIIVLLILFIIKFVKNKKKS